MLNPVNLPLPLFSLEHVSFSNTFSAVISFKWGGGDGGGGGGGEGGGAGVVGRKQICQILEKKLCNKDSVSTLFAWDCSYLVSLTKAVFMHGPGNQLKVLRPKSIS